MSDILLWRSDFGSLHIFLHLPFIVEVFKKTRILGQPLQESKKAILLDV